MDKQELKYQIAIQTGVVRMVSNHRHEHHHRYWEELAKLQKLEEQLFDLGVDKQIYLCYYGDNDSVSMTWFVIIDLRMVCGECHRLKNEDQYLIHTFPRLSF